MSSTCQPFLNDTEQRLLWKVARMVLSGLLGNTGTCGSLSGAGDPTGVTTPTFIGQLYHDTVSDSYYRSTGTTSADWVAIGGAAANAFQGNITGADLEGFNDTVDTLISFPLIVSALNLNLYSFSACTSISMPLLDNVQGLLYISDLPAISTISFPSLVTVFGVCEIDADVGANTLLNTINLPLLTTIIADSYFLDNPALVNFSAPNWLPSNGTLLLFTNDALSIASVEMILARCVAAGVTTCTIDLSGGTNAGLASLSPAGQADAATLGAQLTINP